MKWIPSGVIPPLATPLTAGRELDGESLARLVEIHIAAGATGLFAGGSTGEAALLTDNHRDAAVAIAAEVAAGRVPVLAGVIDTGTARVIDHARRAVSRGASAVVVTPPFYVAPNDHEIIEHYRKVAAAVDAPVVAYNIPSNVHVPLSLSALEQLASDEVIIAVKDSSGDLASFRRAVERIGQAEIGMLTGSEIFSDLALRVGASGIVPGLGNIDPDGYCEIQRAADRGDWDAAAKEQRRLVALFGIVEVADRIRVGATAAGIGGFKAAMYVRGYIDTPTTADPLAPLTDHEIDRVREIVQQAGLTTVR